MQKNGKRLSITMYPFGGAFKSNPQFSFAINIIDICTNMIQFLFYFMV